MKEKLKKTHVFKHYLCPSTFFSLIGSLKICWNASYVKYETVHVTYTSDYIARLEGPLLTHQTALAPVYSIYFALVTKLA
jgi:hypothetical protein